MSDCTISDCPDPAVCVATVIVGLNREALPGSNNYSPMCKFHCGPGHGIPAVCQPV